MNESAVGFEVLTGGALTTVQDEGRFGFQQYGVTPGGPMDTRSFHLANLLVGNPMGEACLEVTFAGPVLRFDTDTVIAVTGGDLQPQLNGTPFPGASAQRVRRGDVLSFAGRKNGCRCYIAFAGGLEIPVLMGSRSTMLRIGAGGFEGRKLRTGDRIGFRAPEKSLIRMSQRHLRAEVFPEREVTLRVVPGPQEDAFTERGIRDFYSLSGTITGDFDRMGCRIESEPIEHAGDGNIITDGISFGSIQIPPTGKPIIMLADRQSTGGYAKIGTVISVDLPLLAQSIPGMKIRFRRVSLEEAQELYLRELGEMKVLDRRWNGPPERYAYQIQEIM